MNPPSLSLSITVSDGDRTRTVPALALAAALRISPREVCAVLRFLLHPGSGEPTEPEPVPQHPSDGKGGRGEGERSKTFTFEQNIYLSQRFTFGTLGGELGEGHAERLAETLAETLHDPSSLAGFTKLARTHPEPLLQEALRRTLQIPSDRITRSRGACFTGIVRKLTEAQRTAPAVTHP